MWRLHRFVDEVGDTAVEVSERKLPHVRRIVVRPTAQVLGHEMLPYLAPLIGGNVVALAQRLKLARS